MPPSFSKRSIELTPAGVFLINARRVGRVSQEGIENIVKVNKEVAYETSEAHQGTTTS